MQKTLLDHIPQTDLEKMRNWANMASRRTSPNFFLRFSNNSYANNFGGKNPKKIRDVEVDALYKTAKFGCSTSYRFRDIARQSFICEVAPPGDRFENRKCNCAESCGHTSCIFDQNFVSIFDRQVGRSLGFICYRFYHMGGRSTINGVALFGRRTPPHTRRVRSRRLHPIFLRKLYNHVI